MLLSACLGNLGIQGPTTGGLNHIIEEESAPGICHLGRRPSCFRYFGPPEQAVEDGELPRYLLEVL